MHSQPEAMIAGIRAVLEQELTSGQVPGAVLAFGRPGQPAQVLALGTDADAVALSEASLFPLASVTKLATALAVLRLVDRGEIWLDDLLGDLLPDAAAAMPGVTLRSLLCHSSGLPLELARGGARYAGEASWALLAEDCLHTALEAAPGTRVQYSNVGYGLLGLIVERRDGRAFHEALDELVLRPLGIEGYLGQPAPRPISRLADVRGRYAGTQREPFNSAFWRGLALPWAGLISTVPGAYRLASAFAGGVPGFLSQTLLQEATRNQTGDLPGGFLDPLRWERCPWALGPELRGQKAPHWVTPRAGPHSFGHSGASGSLAWADPQTGLVFALAGARTADSGWLLRRAPAISAAIYDWRAGMREE